MSLDFLDSSKSLDFEIVLKCILIDYVHVDSAVINIILDYATEFKGELCVKIPMSIHGISVITILSDNSIVVGSWDSTISIWKSDILEFVLRGHNSWILALETLDNDLIASGSLDSSVKLWDGKTGQFIYTLQCHTHPVRALAKLNYDNRLATGSDDNIIRIWDIKSGICLRQLNGHTNTIMALAAMPDGRLVSGACDHTICIWRVSSNIPVRRIQRTGCILALRVLSKNLIVAGTKKGIIDIWNLKNFSRQTLKGHTKSIFDIAILLDGRIASCSLDSTIRIWSPYTLTKYKTTVDKKIQAYTCVKILKEHIGSVNAISVDKNNKLLSSASDGSLLIWK